MAHTAVIFQRFIDVNQTGVDALTLAAARTSSWIDVSGFSQMTIMIAHTRSAATNLTFNVERSELNTSAAGSFGPVLIGNDAGSGTVNYYPQLVTIPTTTTKKHYIDMPINDKFIRIKDLNGASATGSDIVSVTFKLSVN